MRNFKNEFYKEEIEKINEFLNNDKKILFVKKDENIITDFLSDVFLTKKEEDLFFYYFCSDFTATEDILLNFYDTLRNFSITKKIILQKSIEEDFGQKIISYIKVINKNSFIVIDNFEKISSDGQTLYFLKNILKNTNSKLILIFNGENDISEFSEYSTQEEDLIFLKQITSTPFENFSDELIKDADNKTKEEFKRLTYSNDFSYFTSLNYIDITGTKLDSLIEEFSNRKISYENFIISKTLSLVPNSNLDELKFLSVLKMPLNQIFIEKYEILQQGQLEYLLGKSILYNFLDDIVISEKYINFFKKNFLLGEKHLFIEKAIKIYEDEITKSPQDRLLRLSREGLRKQISYLNENKPNVNLNFSQDLGYNFNDGPKNIKAPWLDVLNKKEDNLSPSNEVKNINQQDIQLLKKINEEKQKNLETISQQKRSTNLDEIKKMIKQAEDNFQYNEAINLLHTVKDNFSNNDSVSDNEIYDKIAQNLLNLNQNKEAIIYYSKIADNYKNSGDYNNSALYELKIAEIYEHVYNLELAQRKCEKIIDSQLNLNANVIVLAHYRLGKIKEKTNEENLALQSYKKAYTIGASIDDKKLLGKIAFALGILNTKLGNSEDAKKYYLQTIEFLEDKQNKNIGICYMNLANIFYDEENDDEAIKYFELAKDEYYKDEENNYSGLYYSNKNLANIYRNFDSEKCREFLEEEFKYAKALGDNFKIINAVVELGDYFYGISEDRKALVYYLYAKNALNDSSAQNKQMIDARIEDMRHKMPQDIFEGIIKQHE